MPRKGAGKEPAKIRRNPRIASGAPGDPSSGDDSSSSDEEDRRRKIKAPKDKVSGKKDNGKPGKEREKKKGSGKRDKRDDSDDDRRKVSKKGDKPRKRGNDRDKGRDERRNKGNGSGGKRKRPGDNGGDGDSDPSSSDDSSDGGSCDSGDDGRQKHKKGKRNYNNIIQVVGMHGRVPDLENYYNSFQDKITFTELIDSFELQSHGLGIPKSQWARLIATYFKESALLEYQSIIKDKPNVADNYDKLVKKLTKVFSSRIGLIKSNELFTRIKGTDSVGKYTLPSQVWHNRPSQM